MAVLVVLAVAALGALGVRFVRQRNRYVPRATSVSASDHDAIELDRLAREARQRGDNRMVVIHSFRAGIARLASGPRPRAVYTPNRVLARTGPGVLESLGETFDRVRYGDGSASDQDAARSSSDWIKVLDALRSENREATK